MIPKCLFFNRKKILLFPVETIVRELDSRLILAILCARPDWQIIIGHHKYINKFRKCLKAAIILLKDFTEYNKYKNHQFKVVYLDEEGGIYPGDKKEWGIRLNYRADIKKLSKNDYFCTWGSFQKNYYLSVRPECLNNILVTGNPRFDICRDFYRALYIDEVNDIKAKYGRIILINTNFSSNNAFGVDYTLKHYNVKVGDNDMRDYYYGHYAYDAKTHVSFIELTNKLSACFQNHTIVLRPHPSENMHTYETFLHYIPRTVVTRGGTLNAWLQASDILIHNGCTTAVEGYQSGIPIVNFLPISDERFDIVLPNLLGTTCRTANEVLSKLEEIFDKRYVPKTNDQNMAALEEMIANFNPNVDAFKNLKEIISKCQDEAIDTEIKRFLDISIIRNMIEYRLMPLYLQNLLKKIKIFLKPKTFNGSNKFSGFNQVDILNKVNIIEDITGIKVNIKFHSNSLLSINLK
jgi:surface carbohydrate biosynthesis protein